MTAALSREGDLGILRIDNPPVNALSTATVAAMDRALSAFEGDGTLAALVIGCAGRTWVAGGDIAGFDDPAFSPAPFNAVLARLEALDRPVVAALHGTALGGGLELALACHARVAHPATRLGLPEITLGILPGSLGTQRLPRLAGFATAHRLISTGAPIGAEEAQRLGIVDALAEDVGAEARAAARRLIGQPLRRASRMEPPDLATAGEVIAQARREAEARPHLPALAALVDCLEAAGDSFEVGARVEAEAFRRLLPSAPARALRHVFFAERAAQKVPGLEGAAPRRVERVGVLGAGTMGSGIAMAFANAGFPVALVDASPEGLARGQGIVAAAYEGQAKRGRLSPEEAARRRALIRGGTDMAALAEADLIVEAVFEDMDLKRRVLADLGRLAKAGAILATNTSTLDVDALAQASGRAADVLGTHFFSPAQVMRLLEVVRGRATAPDALATVMGVARRIGKTAVVSGVCYGFIGNRMAEVYMRESEAMQLEGASPSRIDGVAEDPRHLGMAMGPSRMLDMAGVDVGARTVIEWVKGGQGPQDPAYRALCRALFEQGAHGQKTGRGFYAYEGREPRPSPETEALAARLAAEHGVARRDHSDEEILERLLYPMVNEAARLLEEGIALRPGDIDVVWTAGYGFPAWRGGPVWMADEIGLPRIVAALDRYAATRGNAQGYWTVSPLLRQLARMGGRLSEWRTP